MLDVEVVNLIFEAEQRVVDRLKSFNGVRLLRVMVVKVYCEESPNLGWGELLAPKKVNQGQSFKGGGIYSEIEAVFLGSHL